MADVDVATVTGPMAAYVQEGPGKLGRELRGGGTGRALASWPTERFIIHTEGLSPAPPQPDRTAISPVAEGGTKAEEKLGEGCPSSSDLPPGGRPGPLCPCPDSQDVDSAPRARDGVSRQEAAAAAPLHARRGITWRP